jgi:hypothetical protein
MKRNTPPPPDYCPVCGEDVPPKALACPECGADYNSGWREDAQDIDDEPEEFDYDDFVQREFGSEPKFKPANLPIGWWIAGIIALIAFILLIL